MSAPKAKSLARTQQQPSMLFFGISSAVYSLLQHRTGATVDAAALKAIGLETAAGAVLAYTVRWGAPCATPRVLLLMLACVLAVANGSTHRLSTGSICTRALTAFARCGSCASGWACGARHRHCGRE